LDAGGDDDERMGSINVLKAKSLKYAFPDQYAAAINQPAFDPLHPGGVVGAIDALLFSGYTKNPHTGMYDTDDPGWAVTDFITKAKVNADTKLNDSDFYGPFDDISLDARELYAYTYVAANDGQSNRQKYIDGSRGHYDDLMWDTYFKKAWLLDAYRSGRIYIPDHILGKRMFSIKWVRDVYAFRAIIVSQPDNPDGTLYSPDAHEGYIYSYNTYRAPSIGQGVVFEPEAAEGYTTYSSEDVVGVAYMVKKEIVIAVPPYGLQTGIRLTNFLIDYLGFGAAGSSKGRDQYTYTITALDPTKSKPGWSYAEMQKAWYIIEKDIICQIDELDNIISGTIVPFPKKIEISGGNPLTVDTTKKHPGTAAYKNYLYN
jgi:hypothetical protein